MTSAMVTPWACAILYSTSIQHAPLDRERSGVLAAFPRHRGIGYGRRHQLLPRCDGLVEILPQRGSRVATYEPQEVEDFFVMFGGFEGTIAGVAALRRTEDQLSELDVISARIDALRSSGDPMERARGYRSWNRRFHSAIHEMAHSRVMSQSSQKMWDLADFLINTSGVRGAFSAALDDRHADHEEIRQALHAGDEALARGRPWSATSSGPSTSSGDEGSPSPAVDPEERPGDPQGAPPGTKECGASCPASGSSPPNALLECR